MATEEGKELRRLRAEVARLEAAAAASGAAGSHSCSSSRPKLVGAMSAEVVDSNPYSRLMALQRMGVVKDYERIRGFAVAVVGLGGIGRSVRLFGLGLPLVLWMDGWFACALCKSHTTPTNQTQIQTPTPAWQPKC